MGGLGEAGSPPSDLYVFIHEVYIRVAFGCDMLRAWDFLILSLCLL